jgi:hypothetical protein
VTVQKAAVSGYSEPLDALMNNGDMRDSISGTVVLEEVEVDVFVAFCEWAYTGSPYNVPLDSTGMIFHAKVYVFAATYLIQPLRDLCLKFLDGGFIGRLDLYGDLEGFYDLVEYTYTHTQRTEAWGPKLRDTIAKFVANHINEILKFDRTTEVMDTYGEFGSDVVRFLEPELL